jgi:hypothetical protein
MPSTVGKGFGSSSKDTSSYQTIFEKIKEESGSQQRSLSWYKNTIHRLTGEYTTDNLVTAEKRDSYDDNEEQDGNVLRTTVRQGHLYLFEYKAKSKWLPYYDRFPLAYVFKRDRDGFYAANFHYLQYRTRLKSMKKLERGMIDIPRNIIHKYLNSNVESLFLDLHKDEWDTSILLPVEDFVMTSRRNRTQFSYDKELVWEEIKENENDRVKAKAIIQDY